MHRDWLTTVKAKEAEATKKAPTPAQPAEAPATQSQKYCAICSPLGKLCPSEYPITAEWQDNFEEGEESQEHVKDKDNFPACSDWNADLEKQDQKNLEMKEQKNHVNKTPQTSPKPKSVDALTLQPSKPCINQFGNQISVSSEETLEDVD